MKPNEWRFPKFTERFRELRGERDNTEFGKFLGISRQTVGFYYNGDRIPDALGLKQIAEKCGVSADWLLGLSEHRTIPERQKTANFATSLMTALARLDEDTRNVAVRSLANIAHGFDTLCYVGGDALQTYSDVVFAIGHVFQATYSCLAVTAQIDATYPQLNADDIGERSLDILREASVAAYTEIGAYIAKLTSFVCQYLDIQSDSELDYDFCLDADKMLKEFREAHAEWFKQQITSCSESED